MHVLRVDQWVQLDERWLWTFIICVRPWFESVKVRTFVFSGIPSGTTCRRFLSCLEKETR